MTQRPGRLLRTSTALTLIACAVLPGSGCIWVLTEPDTPLIRYADAFCASDGFWEVEARVTHPAGTSAVVDVWVEVEELLYDPFADVELRTYLGDLLLDPEGGGFWFAAVPSDRTFLDCGWPDGYRLTYVAEDIEGDLDAYTIFR